MGKLIGGVGLVVDFSDLRGIPAYIRHLIQELESKSQTLNAYMNFGDTFKKTFIMAGEPGGNRCKKYGPYYKDVILILYEDLSDLEGIKKIIMRMADWLNAPVNNTQDRHYYVPENWNQTPSTGPYTLGDIVTTRDLVAFLSMYYGEEQAEGLPMMLPPSWADNNKEIAQIYVNLQTIDRWHAEGIGYTIPIGFNAPEDAN